MPTSRAGGTSNKWLPVVIAGILLLFLSIFILRDILFQPGRLFVRDFIFPDEPNFPLGVWNWFTSSPNLELNKIPINLLFTVGYSVLGSSLFINSFHLFTLFLVGFIPFLIIYFVLLNNVSITPKRAAIVAAIPSLIYLLNPWVLDRLNNHIFMVLGMAFLPLLFFLCYRAFDGKFSWVRSLRAGACLAFVSLLSSHNIFYWVPLIVLLVGLLLLFNWKNRWSTAKSVLVVISVFFLLSAFWILPLLVTSQSSAVQPSYDLTYTSIEKLSANNTPLDVFNLIGGGAWRAILIDPPIGTALRISFGLFGLVMAVLGIFYYPHKKLVVIASTFLIVLLLLSMGTNAPIPIYKWLFDSPLQSMIWLYRDPSRFIQFLLVPIITLAAFSTHRLLNIADDFIHRRGMLGLILIGLAFVLFASPAAYSLASGGDGTFRASAPPPDYEKVSKLLKGEGSEGKALWLPVRGYYFYNWNKASDVAGDFYTASSPIPTYSLNTSAGVAAKMNQYIYQKIVRGNRTENLGVILAKINVQYAIVHTDLSGWQGQESLRIAQALQRQQDLQKIYESANYQVFKNLSYRDNNIAAISNAAMDLGNVNNLAKFDPKNALLHDKGVWRSSGDSTSKGDDSYDWRVRFDEQTNMHSISYDFENNGTTFAPYDKVSFSVFPGLQNTGTELSVVVETSQGDFTFNRYDLEPDTWNDVKLNLRAADEISVNKGAPFNLNIVERITFNVYGKTSFGYYYQPGENSLTFKNLSLQFDDTYGDYDPKAVIDMFNKITPEKISYIKHGSTYRIKDPDAIDRDQALVLGESFDPSWRLVAHKGGESYSVKPQVLYGVVNTFPLKDIPYGSELVIAYKTEGTHRMGLIISLVSLLGCSCYLLYAFFKSEKEVGSLRK